MVFVIGVFGLIVRLSCVVLFVIEIVGEFVGLMFMFR